jgi:putative transposase
MKEMFRRRRLPHWDIPGATYFITSCLEGSIPAQGLLDLATYRDELAKRPQPKNMSEYDWEVQRWKLAFARSEEWLDARPAIRHLVDGALAKIVADALYFFAGTRYTLLAYVVMPSHFHWVFTPFRKYEESLPEGTTARQKIMHSINRYSGNRCNAHLGLQDAFWQRESYDHCVGDEDELERIVDYVELNPVKAGLVKSREQWVFSSAYDRVKLGIPLGHPLVRAK